MALLKLEVERIDKIAQALLHILLLPEQVGHHQAVVINDVDVLVALIEEDGLYHSVCVEFLLVYNFLVQNTVNFE